MKYKHIAGICLVIFLIFSKTILAQESGYTLHGCLKSIDGEPLKDVTISVMGSSESPSVSDEKGNYTIKVTSGEVWLSYQPIGKYIDRKIYLDNRKVLNVFFINKDLTSAYDIVLGEGQERNSQNVITAHQNITEKDMRFSGNSTIDQFFQTSLGGANVANMSGMPGVGTTIFLRGLNTINAASQPLYVVDGIPMERPGYYFSLLDGNNYNPLTSIDPMDVSYITAYKDPSYNSQYGFYGSNGVIEFRTINPDASKTTIDVKYRTGITLQPEYQKQLESVEYKTLANELLFSSGMYQEDYIKAYPGLFYTSRDSLQYIPYSNNTNWQNEVFQNAMLQNFYFSIKGGDAIAKYGISFGYLTRQGLFKSSSYDKFNTRFVGTFNVIERIKMYLNVNLVNSNSKLQTSGIDEVRSPILAGLWKSPLLSPYAYDENGNQLTTTADVDELGVSNPLALSRGFEGLSSNTRFSISSKIVGELTKKLKLTTLIGVNYNSVNESTFSPDLGMEQYLNGEVYNETASSSNTYIGLHVNSFLSYFNELNNTGRHKLRANLGAKTTIDQFQSDFGKARNTPSDDYTSLNLGVARLNQIGGNNVDYKWMSVYGNLNYSFKNKYLLDLKISSDASSSIGIDAISPFSIGDVPFELFYSAGASWRLSNENFMNNISLIEDLKLRASYGFTGSDGFDVLLSRPYYTTDHYNVLGVSVPGRSANTGLKSEKTGVLNFGFDLSLKGGRHQLSLDIYNSVTSDLLIFSRLPSFIGEDYYPLNSGKMRNRGAELSINSRLIAHKDFALDLGISIGANKNSVLELPEDKIVVSLPGAGEVAMKVGEEPNSFYGYKYKGVFSTTTESNSANLVNAKGIPFRAGDAIYEDISGKQGQPDGIINNYDKVKIGSPNPDLTGAFTTKITYKNLALKATTQFVLGQDVFNYVRYENEKMTNLNNQSIKTLQRWSYQGQQTEVPIATWNDPVGNSDFSSRWIEDGSYIRLKELTLSYSPTKQIIPFLRNVEAFITMTNVFTMTKYLGYDPEFSYSYNPLVQGIDYGLTPQSRSFSIGVNIGL